MMPKATRRAYVELPTGEFVSAQLLKTDPDLALEGLLTIKMLLKEALDGLGPIFGRDALLRVCADVINEDFDTDRPQTPHPAAPEGR